VALAGWRAAHGMSQSALARRMGVSQPVIARLEIGEHEPSTATLRKIADATGLVFTVTIGQGETRVMVTRTVGTTAAVA
jgi:transcriptional regulator with XRE-family HTH domain